jgi:hypothetical protein
LDLPLIGLPKGRAWLANVLSEERQVSGRVTLARPPRRGADLDDGEVLFDSIG